jgi:superfamily II DNA or RNA helicase
MKPSLHFEGGTLVTQQVPPELLPDSFVFDDRIRAFRGPAIAYHALILSLHRAQFSIDDQARDYIELERPHKSSRTPRAYQNDAVNSWWNAGRRGVVVLPTGAGKSFVAELAIARANRSALILAPTIDLVSQWHDNLTAAFGEPIGVLGGGVHQLEAITVSTYDSAHIHMHRYGNKFGLVIFDECHHLPSPAYASSAEGCLAPFRLGLTATPERPDEEETRLDRLIGPISYRLEITDLAGEFLADYQTITIRIHLTEAEMANWKEARETYREFVRIRGISVGRAGGWQRFLQAAAGSTDGRAAHQAWLESRRILHETPAKLSALEGLLRKHKTSSIIIFTNDNATVYRISKALLIPAITHHTDIKERKSILDGLKSGALRAVVTSRVLNEGVDIPGADVAIVLSGTGTVREHVQRLGRILRPADGKFATLYELVVADTTEEFTSQRRRDHVAYDR